MNATPAEGIGQVDRTTYPLDQWHELGELGDEFRHPVRRPACNLAGGEDSERAGFISETPRHRQRLVRVLEATKVGIVPEDLHPELDEQLGANAGVLMPDSSEGGFERAHTLGVDLAGRAPLPAGVGQRRLCEQIGITELGSQFGGVEQGLSVLGLGSHALGCPEADHQRAAPSRRFVEVFGDLEGLAEEGGRLVKSTLFERPLRRHRGIVESSTIRGAGTAKVIGERGRVTAVRLEEFADLAMASGPACCAQLRHRGSSAPVRA